MKIDPPLFLFEDYDADIDDRVRINNPKKHLPLKRKTPLLNTLNTKKL
jgi:hypothetical protein